MSNFTIETIPMRPGASYDCNLSQCLPFAGGVCAYVPNTTIWWCCAPNNPYCWSPPQVCNYTETDDVFEQVICSAAGRTSWCCSSEYERCPVDGAGTVCTPKCPIETNSTLCTEAGYLNQGTDNPAIPTQESLVFGTPTSNSSLTQALPTPASNSSVAQGITAPLAPSSMDHMIKGLLVAAGALVGFGMIVGTMWCMWKRHVKVKGLKKKKTVKDEGPAELSVETNRTEMHGDSVVVMMHEMEAPERYEMEARADAEIKE